MADLKAIKEAAARIKNAIKPKNNPGPLSEEEAREKVVAQAELQERIREVVSPSTEEVE